MSGKMCLGRGMQRLSEARVKFFVNVGLTVGGNRGRTGASIERRRGKLTVE